MSASSPVVQKNPKVCTWLDTAKSVSMFVILVNQPFKTAQINIFTLSIDQMAVCNGKE